MFRMDFGGITTVTHVAVDSEETDNRTSQYYQQYNCPFEADTLNVAVHYSGYVLHFVHNWIYI